MNNTRVGLHEGFNRNFTSRLSRYCKILEYNNIDYSRLYLSDATFWQEIRKVNYFVFPWSHKHSEAQIARTILPVIEKVYNIKSFPDQKTCWHYDDKLRQHYLLSAYNLPIINTWIFWDKETAMEWIKSAPFPLVFKLKVGAASSNVALVQNQKIARKLIKRIFSKRGILSTKVPISNSLNYMRDFTQLYKIREYLAVARGKKSSHDIQRFYQLQRDYILFQEFLPNNPFDVRVTVIGNRAFAFIRHVRPNDFRASGSGRIDYDIRKIDDRCIKIAFEISKSLQFQSMAYDFVFDKHRNPKIAEISYTFVDTAIYNSPGYFDNELKWHEGRYWPQYCQLDDLISEINLSQPPEHMMLP